MCRWNLVAFLFLGGCGQTVSEEVLVTEVTPGPHQVDYHVSWDTSGVTLNDGGLELRNNLDYEIELSAGYLVFYSTQLVPCEDDESSELARGQTNGIDWGKWWDRVIGIRTAHAGHGDEDMDPSVMAQSYVENLIAPESMQLGSRIIEGTRYCQIHYLVARGGSGSIGLPEDQDMVGASLYMTGTWSLAGEAPQPFTILSSVAYGTLANLYPESYYGVSEMEFELDASLAGARVEIERDLYGLFEDLNFETMTDTQMERRVLQNVIEYSRIHVETIP